MSGAVEWPLLMWARVVCSAPGASSTVVETDMLSLQSIVHASPSYFSLSVLIHTSCLFNYTCLYASALHIRRYLFV